MIAESVSPTPKSQHPKFVGRAMFQAELRRKVDAYFERTGHRRRDCASMYFKTAVLVTAFAALYVGLVFFATAWWNAVPLAILLGFATAAIGLNIQHDGGHDAYSEHPWVNKLMSMFLDVIGGSSYVWRQRHTVLHHTYVNITGHDTDIDLGALGRVTPHQKRLKIHRWQHWYMWPLYGFMAIRWQMVGDHIDVIGGKVSGHPMPRPRGWDLAVYLGGKAIFLVLAFGLPLLFHSWWVVLIYYGTTAVVVGITLSVVFQLSHVVEEAEFVAAPEDNLIENAWAIHQVESTVDFARRSKLAAWLLGGLNFQIEHHLFPKICHVHYPALAPLVEETCREFGIKCHEHPTFWHGVASHFRWLREMGRPVNDALPA